ncbi:hypothetical protein [Dyadobacter psychrotolerans]|uniref:Ig-like domain-containing protein n=1 Tax=Dyadobacter psychrotolerans TaxID=2541721 RepID=A0A4R5DMI1_9BACT|nr:hypothetical protein [Dyadobacter psychrotolerans]TDE12105.1 hypothetical protein E0F88_23970 [Dyadobacter psychrotolerans]
MKSIYLFVFLLITCQYSFAQVTYEYDAAGNRVKRTSSPAQPGCNFTVSASNTNSNPPTGAGLTLNAGCSGSDCSGVSYSWSGNGVSGTSSSLNITAPGTAGTYTYTVIASKSGCSSQTSTTTITVGGTVTACAVNKVKIKFRTQNDCCMDRLIGAKIQAPIMAEAAGRTYIHLPWQVPALLKVSRFLIRWFIAL